MTHKTLCCALLLAAVANLSVGAQTHLRAAFISDSTSDAIYRVQDLDCDGTYNGLGEVQLFYSDTIGTFPFGNNIGLALAANGDLFVSDSTEDVIFRLRDIDGDGTAHSAGECTIAFDGRAGGNPNGILLTSANDIEVDTEGNLWVANANAGSGGIDAIIRLHDADLDGDFQSANESLLYYVPLISSSVGDSLPADVRIGLDGAVYYLDVGSTGAIAKGIYRLEDLDGSGTIDQPGEATPFFLPTIPIGGSNQFFWSFAQDSTGAWYLADTFNELVYQFRDVNSDKVILNGVESKVWWQSASSSNIWSLGVAANGAVYAAEDQTPDRILLLEDLDNSGTVDPVTEAREIYNDTIAVHDIARPRCLELCWLPPLYNGNDGYIAISVQVQGESRNDGSNVHCVKVVEHLLIEMSSPLGTLQGRQLALMAQVFPTGSAPAPIMLSPDDPRPCVYFDLSQPVYILLDGFNPGPGSIFSPVLGPFVYSAILPSFLANSGLSIMLEAFALDPLLNFNGFANAPSQELRIQ